MPVLNWVLIPPSKIKDSIFNDINDEELLKTFDFSEFKETFKLESAAPQPRSDASPSTVRRPTGEHMKKQVQSALDMNRARNLAIAHRRIGMKAEQVVAAIAACNTVALPAERAELLRSEFMPNDDEVGGGGARSTFDVDC